MKSIRKTALIIGVFSFFVLGSISYAKEKTEPVDYVNPYMGNISHLLVPTFPTILLPGILTEDSYLTKAQNKSE